MKIHVTAGDTACTREVGSPLEILVVVMDLVAAWGTGSLILKTVKNYRRMLKDNHYGQEVSVKLVFQAVRDHFDGISEPVHPPLDDPNESYDDSDGMCSGCLENAIMGAREQFAKERPNKPRHVRLDIRMTESGRWRKVAGHWVPTDPARLGEWLEERVGTWWERAQKLEQQAEREAETNV